MINILRTDQIEEYYWIQIVREFNKVFKENKDIESFKNYYYRTFLGYSFHALGFNAKNEIIAYNSFLPFRYNNLNEELIICLSGGTFVVENERGDIFILERMMNSFLEYSNRLGFSAVIGIPNDNSFDYLIKFLDFQLVTYLPYYIFPYNFPKLFMKRGSSFVTLISKIIFGGIIGINEFISYLINSTEKGSRLQIKKDDLFYSLRFKNDKYKEVMGKNFSVWYRVVLEQNIKTAYLMDFCDGGKRTYRSLTKAVKFIIINEKVDIVLYIGTLKISQFLIFKVPRRFEPRKLPFTFKMANNDDSSLRDIFSDSNNWDFGLLNFDVR